MKRILIGFIAMFCSVGAAIAGPTPEDYVAKAGGDAKLVAAGELKIDAVRMTCGQRPTVLDPNLDDFSAAYPGFIVVNPKRLAGLATPVKLWTYAHACGFQFRGPDPQLADCFSVQRGRRQGWLTPEGLDLVCQFISPSKASAEHQAGPVRCARMRECFADPTDR